MKEHRLDIPDNNISLQLIADGSKGEEERGEKGGEGEGEGGLYSNVLYPNVLKCLFDVF